MEKEKRKKQKVLMPAGIRSKLMAAASMLMVGVIMMVSSTYAWFTLSTAPEVKNISTTVAGNGSLEIALVPTSGNLGEIKAGAVGEKATVGKNVMWGNQIDLSDDSYGLSSIVLQPASLNMQAEENGTPEFVAAKPLTVAAYGYDGRIASLNDSDVGVKGMDNTKGFAEDNYYGVRAIGKLTDSKVTTTYGYVVDLALRVNAQKTTTTAEKTTTVSGGKLLLQTQAANRIYSGSSGNEELMGGGSTMTFSVANGANLKAGALKELLSAIRITFVQNYGLSGENTPVILGTARLDVSGIKDYTNGNNVGDTGDASTWTVTTSGKAPIYLYTETTTTTAEENKEESEESGGSAVEKTTTTLEKDTTGVLLDSMEKNKTYQISAIVWLDGAAVKNANMSATTLQSLTGSLNLQFSTDIELVPAVNTPLKGTETAAKTNADTTGDQTEQQDKEQTNEQQQQP